jgi:hypothetical protein
MLRNFRMDFDKAAPAQQAAILRQMREIADQIPGDTQPDIAVFLATN